MPNSLLPLLLAGFGSGISLIAAIGAQNAFILRQASTGRFVLMIVATCLASDIVLIGAGTAGVGVVLDRAPWALTVLQVAGIAFLLVYGLLALHRATTPVMALATVPTATGTSAPVTTAQPVALRSAPAILATTLAFTWLNPHTYLDTVVMLGSLANSHGSDGRWWFALGAMAASTVWFFSLGYGARRLGPWLRRPRVQRVLDFGIAAIMLSLAARLAFGL